MAAGGAPLHARAMFILSTVEDTVRIVPSELARPTAEATLSVIERNFLDKVRACVERPASVPADCDA